MIESSIARRYAKALLELGKESGKTGEFLNQLGLISEVSRQNPMLLEALSNRFTDLGARLRVVNQLQAKLKLDPLVGNFLKLLLRKGRIGLFGLMVEAYRRYVFELENKIEALITTAKPLAQGSTQEIEKVLEKITRQKVVSRSVVNPDVLGGVSIQVGGKIYDGTVKGDLERLGQEMKKTVFV